MIDDMLLITPPLPPAIIARAAGVPFGRLGLTPDLSRSLGSSGKLPETLIRHVMIGQTRL
ncbi:hypothetical protein ACF1BQ_018905 [Bradyrhizobium sp. RDT10]